MLEDGVADSGQGSEEEESEELESSGAKQETPRGPGGSGGKGPGPAGINAAEPQCFMPGCDACVRDAAAAAGPLSRKLKRRMQRRELSSGHSQCHLRDELEIDARMHQGSCGHHAAHAERPAALASIFLLMAQPTLSA